MSVSCEMFLGYTITLKENLTAEDFEFFEDFNDKHPQYSQWNWEGKDSTSNIWFIEDGMNGDYARLIYVQKHKKDCWCYDDCYEKLDCGEIPDNVYEELNTAYKSMYNKELDKSLIEYAMWYHFS